MYKQNKIEQKIVNLLDEIGAIWPPAFLPDQLKRTVIYWQRKLYKYDTEIIKLALDELSGVMRKKPTLADMVEICKKHYSARAPIAMPVFNEDFITHDQFRRKIVAQFGEEVGKIIDRNYIEYKKAKENNTLPQYIEAVLAKAKNLQRRLTQSDAVKTQSDAVKDAEARIDKMFRIDKMLEGGRITVNKSDPSRFDVEAGRVYGYTLNTDKENPVLEKKIDFEWDAFVGQSVNDIEKM
jgi:hypothetical protein